MSEKRFLQTLQALLTMVDPNDPTSVNCVKSTLSNLLTLALSSHKCDAQTLRLIRMAVNKADLLIEYHMDFAGVKGEYYNNAAKQQRLKLVLCPGC